VLTLQVAACKVLPMTKTEAAEILGNMTCVMSRKWNKPVGKDLVEHVITEARYWHGLFPAAVAANPSWRTVLRFALKQQGMLHD
jgi:hypothetical protein